MTEYNHIEIKYLPLEGTKSTDFVAVLSLNRPNFANALSTAMVTEMSVFIDEVSRQKKCRLLILRGAGKHFCAGADLTDMQQSSQMSEEENNEAATELGHLFLKISELRIPTIALLKGAVYGGGVGLAAACDFALALPKTRFCLSELKLGLIPAVIFPYLRSKISLSSLNRFCLGSHEFSAGEALRVGLLAKVIDEDSWAKDLKVEIDGILSSSPYAQSKYFHLLHQDPKIGMRGLEGTASMIAEIRSLPEAQHGLASFFAKKPADWVCFISPNLVASL